jgi:hypothetical protein
MLPLAIGLDSTVRRKLRSAAWGAVLTAASLLSFSGSLSGQSTGLAGADLFSSAPVRDLRLQLAPEEWAALGEAPRRYVRATVTEGTNVFRQVGLHLKGSRGSYQELKDKPSFTLTFDRFASGQRFHGLRRIHLNNSVEDPSYVHESLGAELFRRAGVPAPRVGHARVQLNGRPLGLYVLKEGFTTDFLALHFSLASGNFYEPQDGGDVDSRMERDGGTGPDDQADLQALAAAAKEPDPTARMQRLRTVLDFDRFLSFMALEVLLGHRDGYCLARNNFRIYHDPATDKLVFLPHGMDVLLGNPDLTLQPRMAGLVAQAILEAPEGRQLYRERVGLLFTNLFHVPALTNRVDQLVAQLRPALGRSGARELQQHAVTVKQRIAARAAGVARLLAQPDPVPLRFEHGIARPGPWRMLDAPEGGTLEQGQAPDARPALRIQAGPVTAASWRARVYLERGRYRFEGAARLAGVAPLPFGRNQGAGLRVAGHRQARPYQFIGDSPWRTLTVDFEVTEPVEAVDLVCELRARQGEVWFDLESLRVVRRP